MQWRLLRKRRAFDIKIKLNIKMAISYLTQRCAAEIGMQCVSVPECLHECLCLVHLQAVDLRGGHHGEGRL